MTKPYDQMLEAERLALSEEIRTYLDTLPDSEDLFSADDLAVAIAALEAYKARVNAFAQLGRDGSFVLATRIQKGIITLRGYLLRAQLTRPQRRDVYIKGNSTLQFLAEDELNDTRQWPRLLAPNSIKYSTDLLSKTVVTIP